MLGRSDSSLDTGSSLAGKCLAGRALLRRLSACGRREASRAILATRQRLHPTI